jgi:uncharacterized protein YlxP (DUF503 family)
LDERGAESFSIWIETKLAFLRIAWAIPDNKVQIQKLILAIINKNYKLVASTDFQSIYNLHETLITMVASDLDGQDNTFEQILDMLDEKVAIAEFPEIDEKELSGMALEKRSVNFVVNFYSAFGHFANHDM